MIYYVLNWSSLPQEVVKTYTESISLTRRGDIIKVGMPPLIVDESLNVMKRANPSQYRYIILVDGDANYKALTELRKRSVNEKWVIHAIPKQSATESTELTKAVTYHCRNDNISDKSRQQYNIPSINEVFSAAKQGALNYTCIKDNALVGTNGIRWASIHTGTGLNLDIVTVNPPVRVASRIDKMLELMTDISNNKKIELDKPIKVAKEEVFNIMTFVYLKTNSGILKLNTDEIKKMEKSRGFVGLVMDIIRRLINWLFKR